MPRKKPYSGTDKMNNQHLSTSAILNIESFFVHKLKKNGCEIRPKKGFFAADLHHRIDLAFDGKGKLVTCENIPRKGPLMKDWEGTDIPAQIDSCIEKTCQELIDVVFDAAEPDSTMSLYLPLIPKSE